MSEPCKHFPSGLHEGTAAASYAPCPWCQIDALAARCARLERLARSASYGWLDDGKPGDSGYKTWGEERKALGCSPLADGEKHEGA